VKIRQIKPTGPTWWRWLISVVVAVAAVTTLAAFTLPSLLTAAQSGSAASSSQAAVLPLHTKGSTIVNAQGKQVRLTGVNWFGMETGTFAPHGLWARNWQSMLDQIRTSGFNTIRLPYSNQIFDPSSKPTGINYQLNPDLRGLNPLQIMDKIVQGAAQRHIMVYLDQHRPNSQGQSPLPDSGNLSLQQWINDWVSLAKRYRNNPYVIGADLHNEPQGQATWGTGNPQDDWRLDAEKAGDAIQAVNPNWLIIVEGVATVGSDTYWWGGNLENAGKYPVQLKVPHKLVYSAHDYGPGVYNQNWFTAKNFPKNMPAIWDKHFGYLVREHIAPVLVGEFGGKSSATNTTEGIWQHALISYMKQNGISYTYWALNPDSGDTGGILNNDWKTINQGKLQMLKAYQWPRVNNPKS
jgi:endoglucanase